MTGTIVKVLVEPGQQVEEGETLVIMEAMKMEHVIRAPKAGFVDQVFYFPGEAVDRHAQLVQFQEWEQHKETGWRRNFILCTGVPLADTEMFMSEI